MARRSSQQEHCRKAHAIKFIIAVQMSLGQMRFSTAACAQRTPGSTPGFATGGIALGDIPFVGLRRAGEPAMARRTRGKVAISRFGHTETPATDV